MSEPVWSSGDARDARARELVRLHHRRRGWAWTGFGSLVALVVFFFGAVVLFPNATGAGVDAILISLTVLLLLAVVGLIAVLVETARLARFEKAARAAARESASWHGASGQPGAPGRYPMPARPHHFPVRHVGAWVMGGLMLAAMAGVVVAFLPAAVNGAAYLVGAESREAFHPVSHGEVCGRGGCTPTTEGYLSGSGDKITLDRSIPLGTSVSEPAPLWNWGTGHNVIDSTGGADGILVVTFFFIDFTAFFVCAMAISASDSRHTARPGPGRVSP